MDKKEGSEDSLVYTYTQSTTLHGIARVTAKDQSLLKRILWAIFFLACFGFFLYFLCDAFMRYFDYPVSTKLVYQTEAKLDFPSVTICNYNQITASYLAKKNDPLLNATVDYYGLTVNPFTDTPEVSQEVLDYMKTVDSAEFYSQGAHQWNEAYYYCKYPGGMSVECDLPEGLMVNRVTEMGVCHTFHPQSYIEAEGKALETNRAGNSGGFSIIIDIQQPEYTVGGSAAGVKVMVHEPTRQPPIFELGVALQPGTEANLALKKTDIISLPEPYADEDDSCVDTEASDYVNPLKYYKYYSFEACEMEHLIEAMLERCSCAHYFYQVPGVAICNLYDSFMCIGPLIDEYYANGTSTGCYKQCREIQYPVSMSQSQFPNKRVLKDVIQQLQVDEQYIKENTIVMNVYFGELALQTVEQEKGYTLQSAIAEIGGYLGLCLGASILTLCELLQLFWDYCGRCTNKEMKNKNSVTDLKLGQDSTYHE